MHWGPSTGLNSYTLTQQKQTLSGGKNFHQDFHTYGLYWDANGLYTYIDDDANKVLQVDFTKESFMQRAKNAGKNFPYNPWAYTKSNAAPFDQKFYLIFNVAVGGTNGYFPDNLPGKPWSNKEPTAMKSFWNARDGWAKTWGDLNNPNDVTNALVIDSVKVWSAAGTKYEGGIGRQDPVARQEVLPTEISEAQKDNDKEVSFLRKIILVLIVICSANLLAFVASLLYTRTKVQSRDISIPLLETHDSLGSKGRAYYPAPTSPTRV